MVVLTVGACSAAREERDAGSLPASSAATTVPPAPVVPASSDALGALTKAYRNLAATKSFRAVMTTMGTQEGKVETKTEVALPDRFHVVNNEFELILIGPEVYRKFPDGRWEKSPTGMAVTSLTDPKKFEEYLKGAKVKLIGPAVIDNTPVQLYHAVSSHSPARRSVHDDPEPFMMKIWVADADGLPRKLEGTVVDTQAVTTVIFYDYNAAITINKPAK